MAMAARWSSHHLRLHRQLLREPGLLPAGRPVLVAVSGGQDSMALLGLLLDLRRLHHWPLLLWHGNHNWRAEAAEQAHQLAAWAQHQGLPIQIDTWIEPAQGEAAARAWRYAALAQAAQGLGASRVTTGHTASDRAETLLLNLARGTHRRGLASLAVRRRLGLGASPQDSHGPEELQLVRPLLGFSRADTARICQELALPIWPDPSNQSTRFSRNRVRQEVLPVLEQLHPGAERRISGLAERLAAEQATREELLSLALQPLRHGHGTGLDRTALLALQAGNQGQLLHHWLHLHTGRSLASGHLNDLLARLAAGGQGEIHLAAGWRLHWQRSTLWLQSAPSPASDEPIA
jgi:tRNA(Ile)-lysidine synthase